MKMIIPLRWKKTDTDTVHNKWTPHHFNFLDLKNNIVFIKLSDYKHYQQLLQGAQ